MPTDKSSQSLTPDWTPQVGTKVKCISTGVMDKALTQGEIYTVIAAQKRGTVTYLVLLDKNKEPLPRIYAAFKFQPVGIDDKFHFGQLKELRSYWS